MQRNFLKFAVAVAMSPMLVTEAGASCAGLTGELFKRCVCGGGHYYDPPEWCFETVTVATACDRDEDCFQGQVCRKEGAAPAYVANKYDLLRHPGGFPIKSKVQLELLDLGEHVGMNFGEWVSTNGIQTGPEPRTVCVPNIVIRSGDPIR